MIQNFGIKFHQRWTRHYCDFSLACCYCSSYKQVGSSLIKTPIKWRKLKALNNFVEENSEKRSLQGNLKHKISDVRQAVKKVLSPFIAQTMDLLHAKVMEIPFFIIVQTFFEQLPKTK